MSSYSRSGRGYGRGGRGDGGRHYAQEERRRGGGGGGQKYYSSRRYDDDDDGYDDAPSANSKRETGGKRYSGQRRSETGKDARKFKDDSTHSREGRYNEVDVEGHAHYDANHGDYRRNEREDRNGRGGGNTRDAQPKRTQARQVRRGHDGRRGGKGEDGRYKGDKGHEVKQDANRNAVGDEMLEIPKDAERASDIEQRWKREEERKEAEEERKRKEEEEKIKREEEEKKRWEEEQRKMEEEKERLEREKAEAEVKEKAELEQQVADMEKRLADFQSLREANLDAADEREAFEENAAKLDSSLKKNTSFVKKLKAMSEAQRDSIVKEIGALNLTKYIGECAAAIVEAKLKMADLPLARDVCCMLHRRYAEFPRALLENWQKALVLKKDSKISKDAVSKLKVDIKIFSDLITLSVLPEKEALPTLGNVLTCLVANDREEHNNVGLVLSFLKHCGADYCGLMSRSTRTLSEKHGIDVPSSSFFDESRQKAVRNLMREYYSSIVKRSLKENDDIRSMDKANRRTLQTKGEISQDRKDRYEAAVAAFNKLWSYAQQLSDLLDQPLPELPTIEIKDDFDVLEEINEDGRYDFEAGGLWEDDDARQFYENLPDLKPLVPGILYKDSHQAATEETIEILEGEMANLEIEDLEESVAADVGEEMEEEPVENQDVEDEGNSKNPSLQAMELQEEGEEALDMGLTMKQMMEGFVASLPNSVNRELIDHTAKDFAMNMNTKTNRNRLVKALFTVHRSRLDLLPFYARLVATLDPLMPDVAVALCNCLRADFKYHVKRKDQINLESKNKTVRFIGELVKFNLFPRVDALNCLKMLLFDFRHHNIAMACGLLECCGRFLFRNPDSHQRTKVYLETMMRKKLALSIDSRYVTMIENAYYYCNPPEREKVVVVQRPTLHLYIRKLLYKDLNKLTVEKVLKQMRKLSWSDIAQSDYTIRCLVGAWNVKYNNIHCLANLLAGLSMYYDWVGIRVVDAVVEDIRLMMEMNQARYNQRRVSMTKYIGELYNYRMVDSGVIFNTLYSFISFGVNTAAADGTNLDPPEHLFRLRLACTLLDTCGQYFDRGSSKKKLDCYLKYLLRYYWFKRSWPYWDPATRPFPIDVEYMMQDAIENLKPKSKLPSSYIEACANVESMEEELRKKITPLLEKGASEESGAGLETIAEMEEDNDLKFDEDLEEDEEEEEGPVKEIEGEERESSQSQSQPDRRNTPKGAFDEDDDAEGNKVHNADDGDDSDMSVGSDDEEDQVVVKRENKPEACAEDADFMAAFDRMMHESIQQRNQESVKPPQMDLVVPSNLKTQVMAKEKQQQQPPKPEIPAALKIPLGPSAAASSPAGSFAGSSPNTPSRISEEREVGFSREEADDDEDDDEEDDSEEEDDEEEPAESGIDFVLITRKGNKQNYHTLNVPLSVEFASKLREREAAQRLEKERMKQLTLNRLEQMEEEEAAMAKIGANQPSSNANGFRQGKSKPGFRPGGGSNDPAGAAAAAAMGLSIGVKPKYPHQKGVPDNVAEQFGFGRGYGSGGNYGPHPGYRGKP